METNEQLKNCVSESLSNLSEEQQLINVRAKTHEGETTLFIVKNSEGGRQKSVKKTVLDNYIFNIMLNIAASKTKN